VVHRQLFWKNLILGKDFFRGANSKQKKKKMKRKAKSNEKNFQSRLGTAWENEN